MKDYQPTEEEQELLNTFGLVRGGYQFPTWDRASAPFPDVVYCPNDYNEWVFTARFKRGPAVPVETSEFSTMSAAVMFLVLDGHLT